MRFRKYITTFNTGDRRYEIEEDYPAYGAYVYVWQNDAVIEDYLQDSVQMCKDFAFEECGIPKDSWVKVEKFNFGFIGVDESITRYYTFPAKIGMAINSEDQLFKELSEKLQFPSYFGFNWDALSECLRDFHWIKEWNILLGHTGTMNLDDETLKTYLEILNDAMNDWQPGEGHNLEVYFSKRDEARIKELMNYKDLL